MLSPEAHLTQRLLLPQLNLLSCHRNQRTLSLKVEKKRISEVCPRCATLCKNAYDKRQIKIKDEPVHGLEVFLLVTKRRYWCPSCQKPFMEPMPGVIPKRRTTQRYRKAVLYACENHISLSIVRKYMKCSSSFIYGALYEQLELKRRTRSYPWPEVIGIDEISFRRNKKLHCTEYASVVVDMKNRRVIEVVEGKRAKDLVEALSYMSGRENVKCVVMDMCDPFRSFVTSFFPNAQIVADKFHCLRLLTPHLIRTLKEEIEKFSNRRHIKALLLSRPQNLDYSDRSRLYKFLAGHPKLQALYNAKERLYSLFEMRWHGHVPKAFDRLLESLIHSPYEELRRFKNTLVKWRRQIENYFYWRRTNGIVEGFNNKIKLVKRMAYGYRSFRNFRLRVLNACAG